MEKSTTYLVFDATGIGKPKDYKAPFTDTFSWPRLIHLSWIVLNDQFKPIKDYDCIIKPEGFAIDHHVTKFSRLEEEEIEKKGEKVEDVFVEFAKSVESADYLVAHNMNIQENIIAAEYMRKGMHPPHFTTERLCLMQEATFYCKLPSRGGGYKWPSLQELYTTLFNQKFAPAGNARADVIAAARSFIMLMKRGELEDFFDD